MSTSNSMDAKLNNLIVSEVVQLNQTLTKPCETNKGFQQLVMDKNFDYMKTNKEIDCFKSNNSKIESDLIQLKDNYNVLDKSMKFQDLMLK